jgi:hypothetical protein
MGVAGRGVTNFRRGIPHSTIPIPMRAGKGSCMRMRNAIKAQKTMKRMGAMGNHHPRTGDLVRKSVDAVSARNRTAEKMM